MEEEGFGFGEVKARYPAGVTREGEGLGGGDGEAWQGFSIGFSSVTLGETDACKSQAASSTGNRA